uniref:Uncharacterized protein n=1 Tax=Rhizophora mucronata TaxID=61149 RepID=A0A2P2QLV6_RHIMU
MLYCANKRSKCQHVMKYREFTKELLWKLH